MTEEETTAIILNPFPKRYDSAFDFAAEYESTERNTNKRVTPTRISAVCTEISFFDDESKDKYIKVTSEISVIEMLSAISIFKFLVFII